MVDAVGYSARVIEHRRGSTERSLRRVPPLDLLAPGGARYALERSCVPSRWAWTPKTLGGRPWWARELGQEQSRNSVREPSRVGGTLGEPQNTHRCLAQNPPPVRDHVDVRVDGSWLTPLCRTAVKADVGA